MGTKRYPLKIVFKPFLGLKSKADFILVQQNHVRIFVQDQDCS